MGAIEHLDVLACTHCIKPRTHPPPSPHPPNLVSVHGNKTCQSFLRFLDNPQLALQDEVLFLFPPLCSTVCESATPSILNSATVLKEIILKKTG